jgi:hypothetical protein
MFVEDLPKHGKETMLNAATPFTPMMLLDSRLNGRFAQASIAF